MANPALVNYLKTQLQQHQDLNLLQQSLRQSGWPEADINEAMTAIYRPTPAITQPTPIPIPPPTVDNLSSVAASPPSEFLITENDYPITRLWMFKAPLIYLLISIIAFLFGYWFPIFLIFIPYWLIANPLIRANFHYALDRDYLVIRQGIFAKKQRNLPYGVIQNVLVKQDLFDRIFGLASLVIENASQGGGRKFLGMKVGETRRYQDDVGASGNKVSLPGLRKADAEALKAAVLEQIKHHPLDDHQSGL